MYVAGAGVADQRAVIDLVPAEYTYPCVGTEMVGAVLVIGIMLNVAVTDLFASIVTVHVAVPEHAPDHPANVEPAAGVAVSVAVVPLVYGDVFPDTVPAPVPEVEVVRVYVVGATIT